MNSSPTRQAPAWRNTTIPVADKMVSATDIPALGRGSCPEKRLQPSANQWTPYAENDPNVAIATSRVPHDSEPGDLRR
jgi:hypothetical protein